MSIDPVATTLMACDEPAASVETAFLGALERTTGYTTDSSSLALLDSDGAIVLNFVESGSGAVTG